MPTQREKGGQKGKIRNLWHSSSDRTQEKRREEGRRCSIASLSIKTITVHPSSLFSSPYQFSLPKHFFQLPKYQILSSSTTASPILLFSLNISKQIRMWSRIRSLPSSRLNLGLGLVKRWLWSKTETGQRFAAVWGNGDYGRLGLRSLDSQMRPAPVLCSAFRDQGLRAIACGGAHTLFLTGCMCHQFFGDH